MPGNIFINYRREDEPGFVHALFARLEGAFDREHLFMDVEGYIKAGDDFAKVLDDQVAKCDVLLAIIGPGWLKICDAQGELRLQNQNDFVRIEIASALQRSKRVIPVLVKNAEIPRPEQLPKDIADLVRHNAVRLTHERFAADCQGLVQQLKEAISQAEITQQEAARAARERAEKEAREATLDRKRIEALERAARDGVSSEEVRKAEEIVNWDYIKNSNDPQEFRNHLARFSNGVCARYARESLEKLSWQGMSTKLNHGALSDFLTEFPDGLYASEARAKREALERAAEAARQKEEENRRQAQKLASQAAEAARRKTTKDIIFWLVVIGMLLAIIFRDYITLAPK
jgi:hypothetical protein